MSTQYTPISSLPYPQATDPADLPTHLKALADTADARLVMRFPDTATRDAKLPAPVAGMIAWIGTPGRMMYYTGTTWVPLAPVPVYRVNVDDGDTTSTTYVETLANAGGDPMAATFTVPASGQIIVTVGSYIRSTASYSSYMSANIRNSSNTVVLPADDNRSAASSASTRSSVSAQFLITGLAAGTTHTATPAYRSGNASNTSYFDTRFIRVDPIP
ncbi:MULTISPECIES: hypothetical protein [unclassified Streptomyces]|uniref:hypothetical protein n=1 Tax=unclassified Streptomyces TaxID=2593676 RepID=UPI00278BF522|nr:MULTISPECIES: hypothetical protein [unclassified Streptomyces]